MKSNYRDFYRGFFNRGFFYKQMVMRRFKEKRLLSKLINGILKMTSVEIMRITWNNVDENNF